MTASTQSRLKLGRRGLILGSVAAFAAGSAFAARWFNVTADLDGSALSVEEAYKRARAGEMFLIDIRRPDEWARTGIGEGAHPLDMRRKDFVAELLKIVEGDTAAPVALICARGVRSRRMAAALSKAGFTRIIDVPEGMMGSGAGQGWLRKGLPVVRS